MKFSFKELTASVIAIMSVASLIIIYFFPSKVNSEVTGSIVAAFLLSFNDARHYLFGSTSGSQAKDAAQKDTTDKLISQLKN